MFPILCLLILLLNGNFFPAFKSNFLMRFFFQPYLFMVITTLSTEVACLCFSFGFLILPMYVILSFITWKTNKAIVIVILSALISKPTLNRLYLVQVLHFFFQSSLRELLSLSSVSFVVHFSIESTSFLPEMSKDWDYSCAPSCWALSPLSVSDSTWNTINPWWFLFLSYQISFPFHLRAFL